MDKAANILIIDDEPQIRSAVKNALREVADRIGEAATGAEGLTAAVTERPELVVLDLGLPDSAGVDVCRELRRLLSAPIMVLSARHSEDEKVLLLNAGADDYVTKPFSVLELAARARAQLRRARTGAPATPAPMTIHGLSIDPVTRRVERYGRQIHPTPTEWQFLTTLLLAGGRT